MREVDRLMTLEIGILLPQMMENAGRNLALLARAMLTGMSLAGECTSSPARAAMAAGGSSPPGTCTTRAPTSSSA